MPVVEKILSRLAPWECLVCYQEGSLLCTSCSVNLPQPLGCCYRCFKDCTAVLCQDCQPQTGLDGVWVACNYSGVAQRLLHNYKFERAQAAVTTLASAIAASLPSLPVSTVVVPLPTASSRVRQRGYDQADLLARAVARQAGLSFGRLLVRRGQSRQVGANRAERHQQLTRAWRLIKPATGLTLLLIDDVLTTGATIESAAKVLRAGGARRIYAATFAQKL